MDTLYLWLNLGSFSIPFLFSFHPRLQFHKKWPAFFPALFIMMAVFLPWDILFTESGFWGFNSKYVTDAYFLGLPLEEWLFFLCIPYACIFTHYALLTLFPDFRFSKRATDIIYLLLVTSLILALWYYYDRWYTFVNFSYALILLGLVYNSNSSLLRSFFATYLVILIPFFLVNGALTGYFTETPVVWYNNAENMGLRLGTIPVEDIIYNLGMLLTVLWCTEMFLARKSSTN
ncbi:MAG: lycopene cyclase [Flavobacteriaceae bacterium]|nr:lycopene cyclase [Flavobacteriaceae bacterium]